MRFPLFRFQSGRVRPLVSQAARARHAEPAGEGGPMAEFQWFDARFFEMLFLVCFAVSWPSSIVKSVKSRTAKGKSLVFLLFAFCGYLCGITSKLVDAQLSYTLFFYIFNCCLVGTDLVLYVVNRRRDRRADELARRDARRLAELEEAQAVQLGSAGTLPGAALRTSSERGSGA